jgi:hypothetical protein
MAVSISGLLARSNLEIIGGLVGGAREEETETRGNEKHGKVD